MHLSFDLFQFYEFFLISENLNLFLIYKNIMKFYLELYFYYLIMESR